MKLALIAPLSLLDTQTTDYQLVLPHLFEDEDYKLFVSSCNDGVYSHDYVILDNGAAEQVGEQVDVADLLNTCEHHPISELAIPDTLGNSEATYQQLVDFFEHNLAKLETMQNLRYRLAQGLHPLPLQFGFVAQGKSFAEAAALIDMVMESKYTDQISTVYIPRLLIKESGDIGIRIKLAAHIHMEYENRLQIHFFGCSYLFPRETQQVALYCPYVRSIDTSLPYVATYHKMSLMQSPSIFGQRLEAFIRPPDYFYLPKEKFDPELLEFNLKVFKGWANGQT